MNFYKKTGKPAFDFFFSLIAILLLSPVIILLSILLSLVNSGSPFFIQNRTGKYGRIFRIIKFRTMNSRKDESGKFLPDSQRLTFFGKYIRQTSLDELPQLINVLKGDMSLIGPRPLLVQYLPLYNDFQKRRHEVDPGITGWAQVKGRNALSWEEKFEYDVWYVDNISFLLDMKILCITVIKVLKGEGTSLDSKPGRIELEPFKGNVTQRYTENTQSTQRKIRQKPAQERQTDGS